MATKASIQTQLLGRKVRIAENLQLHKWLEHAGKEATVESVHVDSEGSLRYTLSLPDGTLIEAYDFVFKLLPA